MIFALLSPSLSRPGGCKWYTSSQVLAVVTRPWRDKAERIVSNREKASHRESPGAVGVVAVLSMYDILLPPSDRPGLPASALWLISGIPLAPGHDKWCVMSTGEERLGKNSQSLTSRRCEARVVPALATASLAYWHRRSD